MAISSTEVSNDQNRGKRRIDTNFFGKVIETTVTSRPAVIHQWIHFFGRLYKDYYPKPLVVGINVQFYRTQSSVDKADTLQLCIGTHCLLIHLSHTPSIPEILRLFLLDPEIHFDGIRNHSDRDLLYHRHGLAVLKLFNLSDYVYIGRLEHTMENLARYYLGHDIRHDQTLRTSNWSAAYLTTNQVQYAVVHAYVSLRVGRIVNIWEILNSWRRVPLYRFRRF